MAKRNMAYEEKKLTGTVTGQVVFETCVPGVYFKRTRAGDFVLRVPSLDVPLIRSEMELLKAAVERALA